MALAISLNLPVDPTVGLVDLVDLTRSGETVRVLAHISPMAGCSDMVMVRPTGLHLAGGYSVGDSFPVTTDRVVVWPAA